MQFFSSSDCAWKGDADFERYYATDDNVNYHRQRGFTVTLFRITIGYKARRALKIRLYHAALNQHHL
jgi:hypothetical protein